MGPLLPGKCLHLPHPCDALPCERAVLWWIRTHLAPCPHTLFVWLSTAGTAAWQQAEHTHQYSCLHPALVLHALHVRLRTHALGAAICKDQRPSTSHTSDLRTDGLRCQRRLCSWPTSRYRDYEIRSTLSNLCDLRPLLARSCSEVVPGGAHARVNCTVYANVHFVRDIRPA